ncbi:restriction endonuclease subunit S [Rhodococcus sp. NPDC059968]|uniref:restriction endonuclease subunit S n=1 Tax=Rhodococcus sp. NPDC059968 TaxID=3347017 RepID=UPI00366A5B20
MTTSVVAWPTKTLAELGGKVTSGSRGWAAHYSEHGSLFVRITNLTRDRIRLDLANPRFVEVDQRDAEAIRTRLAPGDLLVSITADIGIIGYVDEGVPSPAYINQHIARVRLDPHLADSRFVAYYLSSWGPQRAFVGSTDTGAKAGMNLATVARLETAVPTLGEQTKIAEALVDVDDLIATLERLIAKKQAIKHGMMQQLLAGRTRLPGFTGEWTDMRLGDVLTVRHGRNQRSVESRAGTVPILATGGQIGWADRPLYSKPSVLIGRKGTIDRPQYQSRPFWTVDTLFYTEIAAEADPRFLYYVFQTIDWRSMNEASGVPSLSSTRIEGVEVRLPDLAEQVTIREALDDATAEITALDARLTKVRAIKTGMMQQLLTGCVRLRVEAAS